MHSPPETIVCRLLASVLERVRQQALWWVVAQHTDMSDVRTILDRMKFSKVKWRAGPRARPVCLLLAALIPSVVRGR